MTAATEIAELRQAEARQSRAAAELDSLQMAIMSIDPRLVVMPQLGYRQWCLLPLGWRAMRRVETAIDNRQLPILRRYRGEIGISRDLARDVIDRRIILGQVPA